MNRKKNIKPILLLVSLILAVTAVAGGTLAFLLADTQPVTNIFEPTSVPIEVEEVLAGNTKQKVTIKNHGEIDAYIRAKVVINWVKDGNIVAADNLPTETEVLVGIDQRWVKGSDNFYYYTEAVPSGGETGDLIGETGYVYASTENYNLRVEFIAQSIQANPKNVVEELWGVDPTTLGN